MATKIPTPLRLAIVHSGRTQRDVAGEAGISEGHLSRIVNGLHTDDATQEAIARAIGKTVAELWPNERVAA